MPTLAQMTADLRKRNVDVFLGGDYVPNARDAQAPQGSRIVDLILGKSNTVNVAQAPFIPKMVDRQIANIERPVEPLKTDYHNPLDVGKPISDFIGHVVTHPKETAKTLLEPPAKTLVSLADIITRVPEEAVRQVAAPFQTQGNNLDEYLKNLSQKQLDITGRPLMYEKAFNKDVTKPEDAADFVMSAAEAPAYAYGGGALKTAGSVGQKVLQGAKIGTKTGLPFGVTQTVRELPESPQDFAGKLAKNEAMMVGGGAALGAGGALVSAAAKPVFGAIRKDVKAGMPALKNDTGAIQLGGAKNNDEILAKIKAEVDNFNTNKEQIKKDAYGQSDYGGERTMAIQNYKNKAQISRDFAKDPNKFLEKYNLVDKPSQPPISQPSIQGFKGGDGLDALRQEASKYKSAKEFVKSKKTAYHGGSIEDIADFNPENKVGDSRHDPLSNIGINLGDKNTAQYFADRNGGKVVETYLDPKKVKKTTYNNLLHEVADAMEEKSGINYGEQIRGLKTTDAKNKFLIDNMPDPVIAKEIADKYREQGFDMITYKNTLDGGESHIPLTKDAIKTKSQLTDIYNSLKPSGKPNVVGEAGKPPIEIQKLLSAPETPSVHPPIRLGGIGDPGQVKVPDMPSFSGMTSPKLGQTDKVLSNAIGESKTSSLLDATKRLISPGKDTKGIQTDLRASRGVYDLNKDFSVNQSKPIIKEWNKLKNTDHLKFIQSVESGVKQPTPQLEQAAQRYRGLFNQDYALAKEIKTNVPYINDYFSHSGIWANPKEAEQFINKWATQSLGGKPNAVEQRVFPTIYDGIKAGLKVKETNPEIIALNNRTQLQRAKMAQDFLESQVAKGVPEAKIQAVLDRYMQNGLRGSEIFQTARQSNAFLNSLQLGLSGFHVAGTAINATVTKGAMAVNDLLTGHPLTAIKHIAQAPTASLEYVFKGNKMLKDAKNGVMSNDIKNVVGGGGRLQMPEVYKGVGFDKALNDIKNGNILNRAKGVGELIPATVEAVAKPIMSYWVPRLKDGAAADLIANKLKQLPKNATEDMISKVRAEAIDSIDNRFGQLVQDNLFWNKTLKDLMGLGMRSPGWNIGTMRELGGGTVDMLKPSVWKNLLKGQGVSEKTAYTAALPLTVGSLGAAYMFLKTGKAPQTVEDYFYPQTGQIDPKTGNPERVSFPTYAKDVYAFFNNPIQTALNKQSPIISEVSQIYKNADYYGNQIRDPYADLMTQGKQTAEYLVRTNLPFSITASNRRVAKDTGTKAESFMGLVPAPGSIQNPGKGESYQAKLQIDEMKKAIGGVESNIKYGKVSPEDGQRQIADLNKRIENAISAQGKAQYKQFGNTPQDGITLSPGISSSDIKVLPDGSAQYQLNGKWKFSDSQKNAEDAILKDKFEKSGKSIMEVGDKVLKKSSTGGVSTQSKTAYNDDLYYQQMTSYKKKGDIENWLVTAEKKANNLQEMLQDPTLDEVEKTKLQNRLDTLIADSKKYVGYGGFTKGKSSSGTKKASSKGSTKKAAKPKALKKMKVAKGPAVRMKAYKPKTVKTKDFVQIVKNSRRA